MNFFIMAVKDKNFVLESFVLHITLWRQMETGFVFYEIVNLSRFKSNLFVSEIYLKVIHL